MVGELRPATPPQTAPDADAGRQLGRVTNARHGRNQLLFRRCRPPGEAVDAEPGGAVAVAAFRQRLDVAAAVEQSGDAHAGEAGRRGVM